MSLSNLTESPQDQKAGWRIKQYCAITGLSRSFVYALPIHRQPRSVKVGNTRVIVEEPSKWLHRIGAAVGRDRVGDAHLVTPTKRETHGG